MIAWSVLIIVQAPKCKPEPVQAAFTKSAIGQLDCNLATEDLVASVNSLDHGKFHAVLLSECAAGSEEKIGEVLGAAKTKDIKVKKLSHAVKNDQINVLLDLAKNG